jgi:4-carboxymuconolactone decarboxylase
MDRLQRLGEYLRYENALGPKLGEMVVLMTAREWTQQYEWDAHKGSLLPRASRLRSLRRSLKRAIDIIGVAGYYSLMSMLMNVARTPLPEGKSPSLFALPK